MSNQKQRRGKVAGGKVVGSDNGGGGAFLTAEDFFSGGPLTVAEIPSLSKDGRPAKVHLRQLPAGAVLDFIDLTAASDTATPVTRREALMRLIAQAVVTPDGRLMFSEDQINRLRDIPVAAFNELSLAVTRMAGLDMGVEAAEGDNAPPAGEKTKKREKSKDSGAGDVEQSVALRSVEGKGSEAASTGDSPTV